MADDATSQCNRLILSLTVVVEVLVVGTAWFSGGFSLWASWQDIVIAGGYHLCADLTGFVFGVGSLLLHG